MIAVDLGRKATKQKKYKKNGINETNQIQIQVETPQKEEISEEIVLAPKPSEEEIAIEMVLEEAAPKPKGRTKKLIGHIIQIFKVRIYLLIWNNGITVI